MIASRVSMPDACTGGNHKRDSIAVSLARTLPS
jgi:hypothetical protein